MKKIGFNTVLVLILFTLVGCSQQKTDALAQQYIVKEASQKAIKYMKIVEKKDIVLVSHKFEQENGKSLIHLSGFEVQLPKRKVEVTINYNDNFTVINKE